MYYDRVKCVTSTTGTGSLLIAGAMTGFRGFNGVVANNDTVSYILTSGTDWELGEGTWDNSANTLSRSVVLSSNSNNLLNLSQSSIVAITLLASDVQGLEDSAVAMAIALG